MYKKDEILMMAKQQLAVDYNCQLSDFDKDGNTITENKLLDGRRIYESDGCFLKIMCLQGRAIICADKKMIPWLDEHILTKDASWLFDYGTLRAIDKKLRAFGHEIDEVSNFYLPNPCVPDLDPLTEIKWFEKDEIRQFKGDHRFEQAFAFEENFQDILGLAALEDCKLIGMAGASEDSSSLRQIGIDVLPEHRGKGIGTNLTAVLKQELLKRGSVPFYKTSISHLSSRNIAINAGFFPAWVELYSKKIGD